MHLDDYQTEAMSTAVDPQVTLELIDYSDRFDYDHREDGGWIYVTLGLGSEVGELQGILKKVIRDHKGRITDEDRERLKLELGDILWYVAMVAHRLGFFLDDVAEANLLKLASRQERGVLGGNGDTR